MSWELCHVETTDGLRLDGAIGRPAMSDGRLSVDAFILLHGTGSNFYAPGVLESFARQAVEQGITVLRVNTRGHDGLASLPGRRGSVRGGAAYETIADCRFDVSAWVSFAAGLRLNRITLVGHSMGAVKCLYAQAHDVQPQVTRVIAISPPRFCHALLQAHPGAGDFRDDYARAMQMVAAGHADQLFSARQPLPMHVTAAGFVAKYGPHDDYDFIRCLPQIECPTLFVLGTESVATSSAFAGQPAALAEHTAGRPQFTVSLVDGADTPYRKCPEAPFVRTLDWLASCPS